ncbi:MAG: hypothetical protein IIW36_05495, partial [Clostridia bacterium]|nr:hypothetical protein [Clostridia bacterium]
MVFAMTALSDTVTVQRYWNLVDLIIHHLELEGAWSGLVRLLGALLCIAVPYLLGSINPAILIS